MDNISVSIVFANLNAEVAPEVFSKKFRKIHGKTPVPDYLFK